MAISGQRRNRTELRKKPRRPLQFTASIVVDGKPPARKCVISDVSESGARLTVAGNDDVPDSFLLLLSRNGDARRRCRVVWRSGATVGVAFEMES